MAVLSFDEITKIINQPAPKWVEAARSNTKKLQVHVNGLNVAQYLNQIDNYENNRQFELRQKFATSNKFIFENLLRPVDKVFSANGGSVILKTKTEQSQKTVNDKIQNFAGGYSLRKWLETTQSNKYYSDPSGLIFFEWDSTETKPTFKDIFSIRNYKANGRQIEWVLFEPFKKMNINGVELPGEYFRFVDSANDYLFHKIDTNVRLIEDETYPNPWWFVPAIINSNIQDSTLNYHISPIDTVVELADHYLRTNSVKNIYEFLHGYPIFWAMVEPCRRCDGTGLYEGKTCTKCNGEGHTFRKDVSDVLKIKPPTNADQPKLAPDIAGYIQPDLETWREQRTELDWLKQLMYFTLWNTTIERADNETATAAFIDIQPVNDKRNKFSDAYEQTEQLIFDIIGKFYVQGNYEYVSVKYGRRYLAESPGQAWKLYQDAKTAGASKISLNYLLIQYYQTEYQNDIKQLAIMIKSIKHEPFIHKTDEEINNLPIRTEDKLRKFYFNEFWKLLSEDEIIFSTDENIEKMFDAYMLTKTIEEAEPEQPETKTEDEPDEEI